MTVTSCLELSSSILLSQALNPGKQCDTFGGQSSKQPDSDGQYVEN